MKNEDFQENISYEKWSPYLFEEAYLNYFEKIKKIKSWRIQEKFILTIPEQFNQSIKIILLS